MTNQASSPAPANIMRKRGFDYAKDFYFGNLRFHGTARALWIYQELEQMHDGLDEFDIGVREFLKSINMEEL